MTVKIDIRIGDFDEHVEQGLQWLKSGLIIAAPLENGYAFLADAFDHDSVRSLHVMRGDALGVVSQVLISGKEVIDGIARDISTQARSLMAQFWPGKLSFNLYPQRGLSWDLGDDRRLDRISVRVPSADFVLAILRKSGPLAVASAAPTGSAPLLDAEGISAREYDLAGIFDAGAITQTLSSTIVSDGENGVALVREGAVTLKQLQGVEPDIIVPGTIDPKPRE